MVARPEKSMEEERRETRAAAAKGVSKAAKVHLLHALLAALPSSRLPILHKLYGAPIACRMPVS